jgi:hypothetical protein
MVLRRTKAMTKEKILNQVQTLFDNVDDILCDEAIKDLRLPSSSSYEVWAKISDSLLDIIDKVSADITNDSECEVIEEEADSCFNVGLK